MKIFFPLELFYPSQGGGPANTVYWITKNLVRHGFQPIIVSTDKGLRDGVELNKWTETPGGRAIYVKTYYPNFPLRQIFVALRSFVSADVVHLSSIFFPTAFMTAFAARLMSKKMVWSPRGELDPAALEGSTMRKRPVLWLVRKLIGAYPVFHSTCDEETRQIRQHFGESAKVLQIPNFIEIHDKVESRRDSYLLYIGRIHPKKAIDNLLRAVALSETFRKSGRKLKIAGQGKRKFEIEIRDLIEELKIGEYVEVLGQVEGIEKQQLLADAYWTLMPSHGENFGIVVLESLAQGTPVIASTGSPWELLETERVGIWTDNSPENLARVIEEVLLMPEDVYVEMRSRCRGVVERGFDMNTRFPQWLELYNSLK